MTTPQARLKPGKSALRRAVKAQRQARPAAERAQVGQAIAAVGLELPRLREALCVAVYASLPDEPDTTLLRAGLRDLGLRVLLPVLAGDPEDRRLFWAQDIGDLTAAGPLALLEPAGPRFGPTELATAQVVIVPALAVDTIGTRLGRGRGYYDLALSQTNSAALILALVHDREVIDAGTTPIPHEPHDFAMHGVITPTRWMFFSPPAEVSSLDGSPARDTWRS